MLRSKIVDIGIKELSYVLLEPKGTIVDGKALTEDDMLFDIQTFNNLKKTEILDPSIVGPANDFLKSLPLADYQKLVAVFYRIKNLLAKVEEEDYNIINAISNADKLFFIMVEETELVKKILMFVENSGINIPVLDNVGTRPQDSKEMTFVREDYITLSAIIVICKICFPLFGETIKVIKSKPSCNRELKEKYCLGIVNTTLNTFFKDISSKLFNYITSVMKQYKNNDILCSFQGYTKETIITTMFASMLVKKFVNINLHKPDGNIMSYAITCVKSTASSMFGKFRTSGTHFPRFEPQEMADDESKKSLLENESAAFDTTSDISSIVKIGIEKHIHDYIKKNNVRLDILKSSFDYYSNFTIPITPINEYIISLFIGKEIGGAVGIRYVNAELYVKAIILAQIFMARSGFGSLVPLLTMLPTNKPKTEIDVVVNHILITKGIGPDYRSCKELLVHLDDNFNWERHFRTMIEFLVKKNHAFNVSLSIQEIFPMDNNTNGDIYKYDKNVIEEIYRFTFEMLKRPDRNFDDVRHGRI